MSELLGGDLAGTPDTSKPPIKVLALNHFFDQDLAALGNHPDLEVRSFHYMRIRRRAVKILGEDFIYRFDVLVRQDLEEVRRRYAEWLTAEVRRMYLEEAFDVMVIPSDILFYARALPEACHALNIPVVVVQKETSISHDVMESQTEQIKTYAPFVSDLMTLCSERHREFWIRGGADERKVVVTGQPRFDAYAKHTPLPPPNRKRIVFFSYDLGAYAPEAPEGGNDRVWESLRSETEAVLAGAARDGHRVLVKPHPQQDVRGEARRLEELAGEVWGKTLFLADPEMDTRSIIQKSNLVVGFQTTTLYEAVAAGRPTIYAAWGDAYETAKDRLLPFHTASECCLSHARSPQELEELIAGDLQVPAETCRPWFEEMLGPVDGHATDRVAHILAEVAREWRPGNARFSLDRKRTPFTALRLVLACATEAFWMMGSFPAALSGHSRGCRAMRDQATERRRHAFRVLKKQLPR